MTCRVPVWICQFSNVIPFGDHCRRCAIIECMRVNGSSYFSRPGPRVVDSLEILAEIIHPEIFSGRFPKREVFGLDKLNVALVASE